MAEDRPVPTPRPLEDELKEINGKIETEITADMLTKELTEALEAEKGSPDAITGVEFTFSLALLSTALRNGAFNELETKAATHIVQRWEKVYLKKKELQQAELLRKQQDEIESLKAKLGEEGVEEKKI